MTYRSIETASYSSGAGARTDIVPPSTFGRPVRLEWLSIASLVVDPAYQRDISNTGRKNVRRIANSFNWSMFTPVIVAPVGGSKFAIVDGQHRTTAAALVGMERVPCAIIEAVPHEQAAAFKAINGNVTKLSPMQLHHASVAAGDEGALHLSRICAAAGVVICRYPKPWDDIGVGETLSPVVIGRCVQRFGEECTILALRTIRYAAGGMPGVLRAAIIYGTAEVLHDHKEWRGPTLAAAFDDLDLLTMLEEAAAIAVRIRGSSMTDQFEARLVAALETAFSRRRAVAQ